MPSGNVQNNELFQREIDELFDASFVVCPQAADDDPSSDDKIERILLLFFFKKKMFIRYQSKMGIKCKLTS